MKGKTIKDEIMARLMAKVDEKLPTDEGLSGLGSRETLPYDS